MASLKPTHIMTYLRSQGIRELFRASDGMRIARQQNQTVIFGDIPNQSKGHVFIDEDAAVKWMTEECPKDHGKPVRVEVRELEGQVIMAPGVMDLNDTFAMRKLS